MKKILSIFCLIFISNFSYSQFTNEISVFEGSSICGCEIYLYTTISPAPLTYDTPGPHTTTGGESVIGNLDKFVDENCERSVYVKVREYQAGEVKYYYDEMVNNITGIM